MKKLKTDYGRRELSSLLRGLDKCDSVSFWYQMSRIASTATGMEHAEQIAKHRDNLIEHGRTTDPERQARIDELEHERDALAAHVERYRAAYVNLTNCVEFADNGEGCYVAGGDLMHEFDAIGKASPATSIARRDARIKAEALEETAEALNESGYGAAAQGMRIRAQHYRDRAEGANTCSR